MAKPILKRLDWKLLLLVPVAALWGWLSDAGHLNAVEHLLLDLRFRLRGAIEAPVKVFYVDVDSRGIQRLGERPWSRARFAEAGQNLFEYGSVKGVGYDFVFSIFGHSELVDQEKAAQDNLALARLTRRHRQAVLAVQYTRGASFVTLTENREFPFIRLGFTNPDENDLPEMPPRPIMTPAASATVGLIDVDVDYGQSAAPRWVPLFAESPASTFWHLGVQMACIELGVPPSSARRAGDFVEIFNSEGNVLRRIPLTENQLMEINWFSQWDDQNYNPRSSIADVLTAGEMMKSENPVERTQAANYFKRFKDAIVLIGPVDPLLQDLAPTPFDRDPVPKVGLHGNVIKTIVSERYLVRSPPWVLWTSVFVLSFIVTVLTVLGGSRSVFAKILAFLVLAAYVIVALHQFAENDLVFPMAGPLGAAISAGFLATAWQLVQEEKQKGRIKHMFGTYLAPELVNQMVESKSDPKLGGHEDIITAYFSDIQSFSTFSELMPASQLVELMNEYLTVCTDIVQEEKGTLDKYIGDAVVAIFGAPLPVPDHAYRACLATIRAQERIGDLRAKWKSEGTKWPAVVHGLRARIGLNTGSAIIGNMGSRTRFSYTMMGDNVNLAARMESGAKSWGAFIMVTEVTKTTCEQHGGDRVVFRPLARIVVKGRSQPVPVYEVVGLKETLSEKTRECLKIFAEAQAKYYARDWDGALELFKKSAALEPLVPGVDAGVHGNPSTTYIEICYDYKETPPADNWNGVYVMTEK
ncbi:CHASE2 domain-containing protein [Oleiharenicola lentus]|uniref:CHASE2 domain-containing protein n=1 Tax=Oleiharenicola lentus TaxID=2508720 RepID=UPI003F67F4D1